MVAKIYPSFWSHPEIEPLDPEAKLAALWLMTNSGINILGVFTPTNRRFTFETGCQPEVLQRALKHLPSTFCQVGDAVFIRNFIRKQYGSGRQLVKNNIWKSIVSAFSAIREPAMREVIVTEYPELSGQAPCKVLQRGGEAERVTNKEKELPIKSREQDGDPDPNHYEMRDPSKSAPNEEQFAKAFEIATKLVRYLNELTGLHFSEAGDYMNTVANRVFEVKYDYVGIKQMVEGKVREWKGTKYQIGLSPSKLFGDEFHTYYAQRALAPAVEQQNGKPMSLHDLQVVMKAKETKAAELKRKYCSEVATGDTWSDQEKRKDYLQLRREMKELNERISNYST